MENKILLSIIFVVLVIGLLGCAKETPEIPENYVENQTPTTDETQLESKEVEEIEILNTRENEKCFTEHKLTEKRTEFVLDDIEHLLQVNDNLDVFLRIYNQERKYDSELILFSVYNTNSYYQLTDKYGFELRSVNIEKESRYDRNPKYEIYYRIYDFSEEKCQNIEYVPKLIFRCYQGEDLEYVKDNDCQLTYGQDSKIEITINQKDTDEKEYKIETYFDDKIVNPEKVDLDLQTKYTINMPAGSVDKGEYTIKVVIKKNNIAIESHDYKVEVIDYNQFVLTEDQERTIAIVNKDPLKFYIQDISNEELTINIDNKISNLVIPIDNCEKYEHDSGFIYNLCIEEDIKENAHGKKIFTLKFSNLNEDDFIYDEDEECKTFEEVGIGDEISLRDKTYELTAINKYPRTLKLTDNKNNVDKYISFNSNILSGIKTKAYSNELDNNLFTIIYTDSYCTTTD